MTIHPNQCGECGGPIVFRGKGAVSPVKHPQTGENLCTKCGEWWQWRTDLDTGRSTARTLKEHKLERQVAE